MQIIENIFPYYSMTNSSLRVREFQFLNIERDINIELGQPEMDLAQEALGPSDRRQSNVNFSLTMEGWMYRRVRSNKIVNSIKWSLGDPSTGENFNNEDTDDDPLGDN